jgi:hypothetical protein
VLGARALKNPPPPPEKGQEELVSPAVSLTSTPPDGAETEVDTLHILTLKLRNPGYGLVVFTESIAAVKSGLLGIGVTVMLLREGAAERNASNSALVLVGMKYELPPVFVTV